MFNAAIDLVLTGGQVVMQRLVSAWTTLPTFQDWAIAALLLGMYAAVVLPLGFRQRFLQVHDFLPWPQMVVVLGASVLSPGLSEELLYRVVLLPHPAEQPAAIAWWGWNSLSLGVFVLSHLLSAYSFFPAARSTFVQPVFLVMAGILGVVCAIAYQQSGSLWTPVFVHWLIVVIWLLRLGGYQKLYAKERGLNKI